MATLSSMTVRLGIDTDRLRAGAEKAVGVLKKIGVAVGAVGVGIPALAATAVAAGGMAAAFASAKAAVAAYKLAVAPQLEAVTKVADLAAAAEEAAAEGGKKAAAAQKAYTDALKKLPPATQATAKAFVGLKSDYQKWSDSLSATTMPVLTKGLNILRGLLPMLTPLVQAAAKAFSGFLDDVAQGVKSAGFKHWVADMSAAAGPALSNFLTVIKNLAIGFGGLVQAFLPSSGQVAGGVVSMSEAFAKWGQSLKDSDGFATFVELAKQATATLGPLVSAAGQLLVALGPLIGITTQVALALAKLVDALPPEVLSVLATAIGTVVIAMKAYKAASSLVEGAQSVLQSSAAQTAGRWVKAAARSTAAFARIAARAVVTAARTAAVWAASAARMAATWLVQIVRVAVRTAAQFVMMAVRAIAWAATMAAQWLIAMGPIGWVIAIVIALVALIIANWDKIKAWTKAAWEWIWNKIKAIAQFLIDLFLNWTIVGFVIKHWKDIKDKTIAIWNAVVDWVKAIPGKLVDLFLNWTIVGNVIKHWDQIKSGTARVWNSVVSWVKGIPGRIVGALGDLGSLLYNKGMDIVRGLWNGIKAMGAWLRSTLMGWARNLIPGPIARALGIASPSKVMAQQIGRWIPAGVVQGIQAGQKELDTTMAGLVDVPGMSAHVTGVAAAQRAGGRDRDPIRLVVDGTDDDLVQMVKKWINTQGGGDVTSLAGV